MHAQGFPPGEWPGTVLMVAQPQREPDAAARLRAANVRTGLVLGLIAAVFFFGVIIAELTGKPTTAVAVIGTAVLLYLIVAIGRHLRK